MIRAKNFFHFCIGNTIGILTDNLLVATCVVLSLHSGTNAVVERVFNRDTFVLKMKKSCDFECA